MAVSNCFGCGDAILDKHVMQVDGKTYHEGCVKCGDCFRQLLETCFARDGILYCSDDFTRRFGKKCASCTLPIFSTDLVQKFHFADESSIVYHVECFTCCVCGRKIAPGSKVSFRESRHPVCCEDINNHQSKDDPLDGEGLDWGSNDPEANTPKQESGDSNSGCDSLTLCVPPTKRRGPRTTIKAKQLDALKAAFAATPKPTRHTRERLAQDTGLSMRVIQVWFQNRRSKERRMKQLNAFGNRRHFFERSGPLRMRDIANAKTDPHANSTFYQPENGLFQPNFAPTGSHLPPQEEKSFQAFAAHRQSRDWEQDIESCFLASQQGFQDKDPHSRGYYVMPTSPNDKQAGHVCDDLTGMQFWAQE